MRNAALTLAALCLALAGICGCSARREPRPCRCECDTPRGDTRLSKELMTLLSSARSYHREADIYLQQKDLDRAIAAVRAILELNLDRRWPEAEEVRLDAAARLAKLLARKGEGEQAMALVKAELARGPRESFYLANLHSVRGELLEAKVKQLDAAGSKEQARIVAKEAITAFEQSIRTNKRLQKQVGAKRSGDVEKKKASP